MAEDHSATLFNKKRLFEYKKEKDVQSGVSAKTDKEYWGLVREKSMCTGLIKRADSSRYKGLLMDTRDQHGFGMDVYPKNLAAAHNMIEDYARSCNIYPKKKSNKKYRDKEKELKHITGIMHAQGQAELIAGTNGKVYTTVKCHKCEKYGHYLSHCPEDVQQHVNIKEPKEEENETENKAGISHLQLQELDLSIESDSDSEDTYYFDFAMYQVEETK